MATRKERCRWCNVKLLVPIEERAINCPACGGVTVLDQNQYNGYASHGLNGNANNPWSNMFREGNGITNLFPVNLYGMGRGSVPQNQPWRPARTGMNNQLPPSQTPAQLYSYPQGRRRAVLCGITYKGHKKSIQGSVNDVLLMRKLLVNRLGFPGSSILVLTEEERDPSRIPTKRNIRAAMRWLIQGCQPGDSLVFYYSGHGSQVRDHDGDEPDGYDESLVPVDYETEGKILDDEINATIVRPLPQRATLHAIVDTCFSGTFLDLPFVCRINREGHFKWDDHRAPHVAYKGTSGGTAISISACDDHQNSADTTAFTGTATGALTYSLVRTLEEEPGLTYGSLLMAIHNRINKAQEEAGMSNYGAHLGQEPQLSSSHRFDIRSKPVTI